MSKDELTALWDQLIQDPGAIWTQLTERFQAMSTRIDGTDASTELTTMLAVAFILGFLFCYVQRKSRR